MSTDDSQLSVLPNMMFFLFTAALIFDGSANPVHPNTIGSIDPHCQVGDVVQGEYEMCLKLNGSDESC